MINNRIFVVGCPRSGTTLLQGLLNTHPEITSFTESHFYDYGIKRPKIGPLYYVSRNAKKLVLSFLKENSVNEEVKNRILNQMPNLPKIPGKDVTAWAKYFISILDTITINRNMSIWSEKTHVDDNSFLKNARDNHNLPSHHINHSLNFDFTTFLLLLNLVYTCWFHLKFLN
ncbi:MAG: sulfotransferase [Fidelibacterota bacterium]